MMGLSSVVTSSHLGFSGGEGAEDEAVTVRSKADDDDDEEDDEEDEEDTETSDNELVFSVSSPPLLSSSSLFLVSPSVESEPVP